MDPLSDQKNSWNIITFVSNKTKLYKKDRDSLDLLKNCSENFTDVIDNKKYSGADFILGKDFSFDLIRWASSCYSVK